MSIDAKFTEFGMDIGPMEVEFVHVMPDDRPVLRIRTPYRTLDVYSSRTGRSLRVFDVGKGEMKIEVSDGP